MLQRNWLKLVRGVINCLLSPDVQLYMRSGLISPNYLLLESSKVETKQIVSNLPASHLLSYLMIRTQSIN